MGGDFLEGWAIGTAIAYRAPSPPMATSSPESVANYETFNSIAKKEAQDFRSYATRLRVNLAARKMSESVLLKALKEENINHPLATEAGFEALFQKMIADQYGFIDSPENRYVDKNGNQQFHSIDKTTAEKEAMLKAEEISTEAGRRAVS